MVLGRQPPSSEQTNRERPGGRVLFVEVDAETSRRLRARLTSDVGIDPVDVSIEVLMSAVGADPNSVDGVLLGPHLADPVRVVQRLHGFDRDLAVMVLAEPARWPSVLRALRFAPFVGDQASAHSTDADEIAGELSTRISRTRVRRAHRDVVTAVQRRAAPSVAGARGRDARLLNQLLDHAPVGIVAVDARGVVLGWNRHAGAVLGRSETESLGSALGAMFPEEDASRLEHCLARTMTGGACTLRLQRSASEGRTQHLEITLAGIDADPDEGSAVVMIQDVTERERLEERLRHAEKMEAVGMLAGGVAHDFNNLLTAVLGYSELLEQILPSDRPGHDEAAEIRRAATRAADLTSQLLAFSRRQVLQPRVLDLNAVLMSLEPLLRHMTGDRIGLRLSPAHDLWPIRADPGQIEQVVLDLAAHARDSMPHGGTLAIATANVTRRPALDLGAPAKTTDAASDQVMLSVTDTGPGVDRVALGRIFEPFFTSRELGRGSGLGLSTVHGIVSQSGGEILAESATDRGTMFRVFLPRTLEQVPRASGSTLSAIAPGGAETVLLVEDEAVVRRLVRGILERLGYTVLEADSGPAALETVRAWRGPLAAVVSDLVLPGMGGRELVGELIKLRPTLRVLFMSGYTDDPIVRVGDIGSADYLQKPFSPVALAHKLRAVIDAR